MRSLLPALLLASALVLGPAAARADDPPTSPPATAAQPVLPPPSSAWRDYRADANKLPYAKRDAYMKESAERFLDEWKKAGAPALGDEVYYLALLQQAAGSWEQAAKGYAFVAASKDATPGIALGAANAEARLYLDEKARASIGAEAVAKALSRLRAFAAGLADEGQRAMRGSIEVTVANVLEALERRQDAHDLRVAIARRDPLMAGSVYRALVWGMLGSSHSMDGYAKMRTEAQPVLAMLKEQQAKAVELTQAKVDEAVATLKASAPDALDEQGNLKNKNPRAYTPLERAVWGAQSQARGAKSLLTRLDDMGKPFSMLGEPVPAWTLEHAFSDTKALADLEGKVVVMDFWATWCPWCIRSFPAIRDLLEAYGEKGLVFVGVTASSNAVYAARYDLDDDLKDKAQPGERAQPAARVVQGSQTPDGKTTFSPEAYKTREIEVLGDFIRNHQMTWPVVMIDKAEPGPKYALGGWPHAVVVDRAGRVRYFKSGALLLDRQDAFEKFKKVLEDLLAEPAPKAD